MLEGAAMKSGGMFRLAKVNVDVSRDIVNAVGATGFPTVFAVNGGKFTDRLDHINNRTYEFAFHYFSLK